MIRQAPSIMPLLRATFAPCCSCYVTTTSDTTFVNCAKITLNRAFIAMFQPNELDENGNTAVFLASEHGRFDVLVALLIFMQQGAPQLRNLNVKNRHGLTPLAIASLLGHSDCLLAVCISHWLSW